MSSYIVSLDEQSHRGKLVLQLLNELRDKKRVHFYSVEEYESQNDLILSEEIKKGLHTETLSYEESKKEFARLRQMLTK